MDRSPPPFFRQGPSANARLFFFGLVALVVMIVDSRMNALSGLRQGIGNVLYPVQRTAQAPRDSDATTTTDPATGGTAPAGPATTTPANTASTPR